jgi:hypothetical protein
MGFKPITFCRPDRVRPEQPPPDELVKVTPSELALCVIVVAVVVGLIIFL